MSVHLCHKLWINCWYINLSNWFTISPSPLHAIPSNFKSLGSAPGGANYSWLSQALSVLGMMMHRLSKFSTSPVPTVSFLGFIYQFWCWIWCDYYGMSDVLSVGCISKPPKVDFGDWEHLNEPNEPSLDVDFVSVSHFEADWNRINIQTRLIGSFKCSQLPQSPKSTLEVCWCIHKCPMR